MAQNSAGGSGGASRYRSDVVTKLSDSTDGVKAFCIKPPSYMIE